MVLCNGTCRSSNGNGKRFVDRWSKYNTETNVVGRATGRIALDPEKASRAGFEMGRSEGVHEIVMRVPALDVSGDDLAFVNSCSPYSVRCTLALEEKLRYEAECCG